MMRRRRTAAFDWKPLFAEAGLPIATVLCLQNRAGFRRSLRTREQHGRAHTLSTPDVPIRIEAAATLGRAVYFEIVAPWTRPENEDAGPGGTSGERVGLLMRTLVAPIVWVVAALLALRNLRLGRGDRRGAMRLSLFILAAGLASNALATGDLQVLSRGQALTIFVPALAWLLYIALEPHLRRVWPETMIGWSRLLAGGVRDPLVGRDVLVGVLVAIGDALILALHMQLRRWSGQPPQFPVGASSNPFDGMAASSDLLIGGRFALSRIIGSVMSIPVWSGTMLTFLLLLVLFMLLRRRSLAMAAIVLGITVNLCPHSRGLVAGQCSSGSFRSLDCRRGVVRSRSDGGRARRRPLRPADDAGRVVCQPALDAACRSPSTRRCRTPRHRV